MMRLRIKSLDFAGAEKRRSSQKKIGKHMHIFIILLLPILTVCFLQKYLYLLEETVQKIGETAEIEAYLMTETVTAAQEKLGKIERERELMEIYCIESEYGREILNQYPAPESQDFQSIEEAAGAQVRILWEEGLTYEKGSLKFQAETGRVEQAGAYITRIKEMGIFSEVVYTGFMRQEDGNYRFTVSCILDDKKTVIS